VEVPVLKKIPKIFCSIGINLEIDGSTAIYYLRNMTIKQRKNNLISWVTGLDNEALIYRLEELKNESQAKLPDQIMSLLDSSNSIDSSELTEHTNSRDLLKGK